MNVSRLLSKTVAGASLVLLVFLFVKTRSIDLEEHDRFRNELRLLTEIDALLDQDLLRSRYRRLASYDPLVENFTRLQHTLTALGTLPAFVSPQDQGRVEEARFAYGEVLSHKEQLLERFKSHNAVLRNSLDYFPLAISELIEQQALEFPAQAEQSRQLLRDVLLYSLRSSEEGKDAIQSRLRTLREQHKLDKLGQPEHAAHTPKSATVVADAGGISDFDLVLAHAQSILKQKSCVDTLVTQLLALPLAQAGDVLQVAYRQAFTNAERQTNRYRLYLVLFSALLVCGIAYSLLRLKQAGWALETANAVLEERVSERTAALEKSHNFTQKIADTTPVALYLFDVEEMRTVYTNGKPCVFQTFASAVEAGESREMATLLGALHPDDQSLFADLSQRFLAQPRT